MSYSKAVSLRALKALGSGSTNTNVGECFNFVPRRFIRWERALYTH